MKQQNDGRMHASNSALLDSNIKMLQLYGIKDLKLPGGRSKKIQYVLKLQRSLFILTAKKKHANALLADGRVHSDTCNVTCTQSAQSPGLCMG